MQAELILYLNTQYSYYEVIPCTQVCAVNWSTSSHCIVWPSGVVWLWLGSERLHIIYTNTCSKLIFCISLHNLPRGLVLLCLSSDELNIITVYTSPLLVWGLLPALWCWFSISTTYDLFLGVKAAGSWGWQPDNLHMPNVIKSGSLNLLEPSGPHRAFYGTPVPLPLLPRIFCGLF